MKICMPVLDVNGLDSVVFGHFGSAPFFAIYDTEKQDISFVSNNESEHEHGQCMPVAALKSLNAEAVLCKGMGLRAANLLLEAGIKPYLVNAESVSGAIACYKAQDVKILDASSACQHHDGCH
jgi:predicted Fe-Mo cluster-binding NifX family protein